MSYRLDADVHTPYANFFDKDTWETVSPSLNPPWKNFTYKRSFVELNGIAEAVSSKTKKVAWFVSDCKAPSGRDDLAKAMQKFIPVDIYGSCGPLQCKEQIACREMLTKDYFFYLSFENTLSRDYITEKAFYIMLETVVPIVYNGVDQKQFLPPHSYIDVDDFKSVKELTDYLEYLIENPEEYLRYFWWKEYYHIGRNHFTCNMCQKLNEHRKNPLKEPIIARDVEKWFRVDQGKKRKIWNEKC